jgi:hypothetical protein
MPGRYASKAAPVRHVVRQEVSMWILFAVLCQILLLVSAIWGATNRDKWTLRGLLSGVPATVGLVAFLLWEMTHGEHHMKLVYLSVIPEWH